MHGPSHLLDGLLHDRARCREDKAYKAVAGLAARPTIGQSDTSVFSKEACRAFAEAEIATIQPAHIGALRCLVSDFGQERCQLFSKNPAVVVKVGEHAA